MKKPKKKGKLTGLGAVTSILFLCMFGLWAGCTPMPKAYSPPG